MQSVGTHVSLKFMHIHYYILFEYVHTACTIYIIMQFRMQQVCMYICIYMAICIKHIQEQTNVIISVASTKTDIICQLRIYLQTYVHAYMYVHTIKNVQQLYVCIYTFYWHNFVLHIHKRIMYSFQISMSLPCLSRRIKL